MNVKKRYSLLILMLWSHFSCITSFYDMYSYLHSGSPRYYTSAKVYQSCQWRAKRIFATILKLQRIYDDITSSRYQLQMVRPLPLRSVPTNILSALHAPVKASKKYSNTPLVPRCCTERSQTRYRVWCCNRIYKHPLQYCTLTTRRGVLAHRCSPHYVHTLLIMAYCGAFASFS